MIYLICPLDDLDHIYPICPLDDLDHDLSDLSTR